MDPTCVNRTVPTQVKSMLSPTCHFCWGVGRTLFGSAPSCCFLARSRVCSMVTQAHTRTNTTESNNKNRLLAVLCLIETVFHSFELQTTKHKHNTNTTQHNTNTTPNTTQTQHKHKTRKQQQNRLLAVAAFGTKREPKHQAASARYMRQTKTKTKTNKLTKRTNKTNKTNQQNKTKTKPTNQTQQNQQTKQNKNKTNKQNKTKPADERAIP